jgi:hypothetical protein
MLRQQNTSEYFSDLACVVVLGRFSVLFYVEVFPVDIGLAAESPVSPGMS